MLGRPNFRKMVSLYSSFFRIFFLFQIINATMYNCVRHAGDCDAGGEKKNLIRPSIGIHAFIKES